MVSNDSEQYPGWPVRLRSALFPVAHRCGCETEASGKLRLAEAEFLTKGSNVDGGRAVDFHHSDSNRDVLSTGPGDGLLYAPDEPAASSSMFRCRAFRIRFGWLRHNRDQLLFLYRETRIGSNRFRLRLSASDRFALSFFA